MIVRKFVDECFQCGQSGSVESGGRPVEKLFELFEDGLASFVSNQHVDCLDDAPIALGNLLLKLVLSLLLRRGKLVLYLVRFHVSYGCSVQVWVKRVRVVDFERYHSLGADCHRVHVASRFQADRPEQRNFVHKSNLEKQTAIDPPCVCDALPA